MLSNRPVRTFRVPFFRSLSRLLLFSVDELGGFSPTETTGCTSRLFIPPKSRLTKSFSVIAIESIRLKKWGEARLKRGATVKPDSVYPLLK